jgi:hypothetical protein
MPEIFSSFLQMRQFNDKGLLLAAGWMEFYLAGTSTLADVYADSQGTHLDNPVELNGAGTKRIFGDARAYRVVIKESNGAQIFEVDNVFPFGNGGSGTGAGSIAVALTYDGVRNLEQDYDVVLVCGRAFSADGGEGVFFKSTSLAPNNDGTVLTHGSTRYTRQYAGLVDPRWFGVDYSTPSHQGDAMDAALGAGVVQIAGPIYLDQDYHMGGSIYVLSGGFYSSATPKLYVDGKIVQGAPGMFGTGIEVHIGPGACDAIRTSWFSNLAQSLCTTYSYDFIVDDSKAIVSDLLIPANYAVDFASGAILEATAAGTDVQIANMVYAGNAQIIRFHDLAAVGQIDFGNAFCLLEWFGGVSGRTYGIDNRIAARAAFQSGRVRLLASYYRVLLASGTAWTTDKGLELLGTMPTDTLDIFQPISVATLTATDCVITGGAAITVAGVASLASAAVMGLQQRTAASAQEVLAGAHIPGAYTAAGSNGMIRSSTDFSAWSAASGISDSIGSITKGTTWIATGQAGRIWKSMDGGVTWTSQAVASVRLNACAFINGTYILVGDGGAVYTSTDAISWNAHFVTTTKDLRGVTFHASTGFYVVVGTAGLLATSPDLVTWTLRPLPVDVIGDLLTVVAGAAGLVASGMLAGAYLRSTDAVTWTMRTLGDSVTIYASAASTDTILLSGSNGSVYTSKDSGIVFAAAKVATSVPLLSASWAAGDWLLGAVNGVVYHSTDLKTFTAGYVGAANDVRAVLMSAPVYVLVGKQNSVQVSNDAATWSLVAPDGSTQDWKNIRILNGLAWLVGGGGRLACSSDMKSFRFISTGTASDLYDIAWNGVAGKYTVCGTSGYAASAPDLLVASPAWTVATAVTADTLIRGIWTGSVYTFASASAVVTSQDAVTLTLQKPTINGVVYTGSMWIQFGNAGAVYTSSDFVEWTQRVSGTTQNLLAGIAQGGTTVLVGATGTCILSTDGVTWSSVSVGTGNQINSITWNAGAGALGVACSGGKAYKSTNLGSTWTSIYSGSHAQDFQSIWARGSEWNVCGAGGLWMYSADGITWTDRTTNVSANLTAGNGDSVVGDSGTMLNFNGSLVVNKTSTHGLSASFRGFVRSVLLDSSGQMWTTNGDLSFVSRSQLSSSVIRSISAYGNSVYAAGDALWESLASTNFETWTKLLAQFVGVLDVQLVSGALYAVGSAGLYASSKNGIMWNYLGANGWTDTSVYKSVALYQAGGYDSDFQGINTMISGGYVVIAGTGIYSGAGFSLPSLTAGSLEADQATSNVGITTSQPGTIRSSAMRSVSVLGPVSDSSFSRQSGTAFGDIVRSTVTLSNPLTIPSDIRIGESALTKTLQTDHTSRPLLNFTGSQLWISTTRIETNGALVSTPYSSKINLADCSNSSNFDFALSNGYAKVSLDRCGAVRNPTAYAIDGYTLDDSFQYKADTILTSSTSGWEGPAVGSVSSNGEEFTTAAAFGLSADFSSANTLRFHLSDAMANLGGRLKLDVTFPASPAPVDVALVATIVHSGVTAFQVYNNRVENLADGYELGLANPWHARTASESVVTWCNAWAGLSQVLVSYAGYYYGAKTMWGTDLAASNVNANACFVVIKNAGTGVIPVGTKIKVSVVHSLPYEFAAYQRFFNQASTIFDQYQNLPRCLHAFVRVERTANEIQTQHVAAGGLSTMQQFLSQDGASALDTWQPGSTYFMPSPYPTDKRKLLPFVTKANGVARLRVGLQALSVLDSSKGVWGGWAPSLSVLYGHLVPEALEVSNDGWYLASTQTPTTFTF